MAADAQYVIDIAATMGGGETTLAQLDELTSQLMGAGKNAEFFQQAIVKVSADLDAARAAAESANDALAQGKSEYATLERAALQAAKAAEKAGLKNAGVVPHELAARAAETAMAVDHYALKLGELEASATGADKQQAHLTQTLANVKKMSGHVDKSIAGQAESFEKLASGLGVIPGPLGDISRGLIQPAQGFSKLSASMGTANAAALLAGLGIAAVAVAIVAVTAAAVAGAAKLASWAVGLADAARTAGLAREALEAMNPELETVRGTIDELDKATGLGGAALRGLAKSLLDAGVSGDDLARSLKTAALAERALGKEGSQAYLKLVQSAHDAEKAAADAAEKTGGIVPKELADKVNDATTALNAFGNAAQSKLGGIVARQMLGLEAQGARLEKNISSIFGGLNIDPVLEGVQVLVALFDESTTAGQTLKFLFETIFQPIIDQAKTASYFVEAFYLGFLIGAVKLYIKLKPAIKVLADLFGFEDTSLTDTLASVTDVAEFLAPIIIAIGAAFTLLVGVIIGAVAAFGGLVAVIVGLPFILQAVGTAVIDGIISAFTTAVEFIRGIDFVQLGVDIMTGLANGITGSASAVWNAITGAVKGAIGAAKSLLGIASPSKVFGDIGDMTGAGFVEGVEAQNDNAQAAMSDMVEPPDSPLEVVKSPTDKGAPGAPGAPGAAGGAAAASAGGGAPGVAIYGDLYFAGTKASPAEKAMLAEELTRLLEGDAASVGKASDGTEAAA
jgi:hypothetical protein